jgi:uncharacterized protein YegP (UPF0339 family)
MGEFHKWQSERDGQWYWHMEGDNGEIIADGEGYTSEGSVDEVIQLLKDEVSDAPVTEIDDPNN